MGGEGEGSGGKGGVGGGKGEGSGDWVPPVHLLAMPLCASLYMCLVVICWERADPGADLLALVCSV